VTGPVSSPVSGPVADPAKGRALARAVLTLALAASVAANVAAAEPTVLGRTVAAVPPVGLFLAIELIARIPSGGSVLARVRWLSAGVIAAVAAWASYWHQVDLALLAGESRTTALLLPLVIDGLVVVASVSLAEIGRAVARAGIDAPDTGADTPTSAPASPAGPVALVPNPEPDTGPGPVELVNLSDPALTTKAKVAALLAQDPTLTAETMAEMIGVTERTVRRWRTELVPSLNGVHRG